MSDSRIRQTLALVIAGAAPLLAFAQQGADEPVRDLAPGDFAYALTVVVPGEAAAYRASLPLVVYQKSVGAHLADLRVFNESGKVVPHSLERPLSVATVQGSATALPLFPVRGDSRKALDSLRITIESGGARVDAQAGTGDTVANAITSYVLDGRALATPVAAFEVTWPQEAPDYAGRLRVEASEDLGNWNVVLDGAPIANLRAGETRLIERRVELPGIRSKFWRLSWSGTPAPFELVSVVAEPAHDHVDVAREALAVPGSRVAGKPAEFEFDLGARLPLDRVNLELPEQNTVVEVVLLSRATPKDSWRPITRSGFYRLKSSAADSQDLANGALTIGPNTDRYWLTRVDASGGGLGEGVPKLRVGWLPHEVVFLARGSAPFTLAFGSGSAPAVATSLRSIPQGATILRATLSEPQTLGGESRLQAAAPTKAFPFKTALLWAVLVIGVALLGSMAYRLARELK